MLYHLSERSFQFTVLISLAAITAFIPTHARAAAQTPTVAGKSEFVRVPSVSEPWAATVGRVVTPQASTRWHIGHYPGFRDAKRQANARRRSMQSSQAAPPAGAVFQGHEAPQPPTSDIIGQSSLAGTVAGVVFDGPSESDTDEIPPDSQIAAGPNNVVIAINSLLAIYDKSGNRQGSFQNLSSFFSSLSITGDIFDPRLIYDQSHQRFILSVAEVDFTNLANGHVFLAVSATSDPTGTWHKFAINFMGRTPDNSGNTFPDFPSLGLSQSAVYITTNQFALTTACVSTDTEGCYFSDAWIKVIGLPELLAGNPALSISSFTNIQTADGSPAFGIQPALSYGSPSSEFLVAADYSGFSSSVLDIYSINTSGTPALSRIKLSVPIFEIPPDAPQPATTTLIATNDYRPLNAVWSNNALWFGQNVEDTASFGAVAAQWTEVSAPNLTSVTVVQSGRITGVGSAYYPAISVNSSGDVGVVYSTSSSGTYASAGLTGRLASDAPGTMRNPVLYRTGSTIYSDVDVRWGDYSGIAEDPTDSNFWTVAEYAGFPNPHFGTAIAHTVAPPPLDISPLNGQFADTYVGSVSASQNFTITNISGIPVTISTVTLGGSDPTEFSLTDDSCSAVILAPSGSCTISANFAPVTPGLHGALITLVSNSDGGPNYTESISLSGSAKSGSSLGISPTSLTFPDTALRTTSAALTVQVTNIGPTPITIQQPTQKDDFPSSLNCVPPGASSAILPAGDQCILSIKFHPVSLGAISGVVTLVSSAANPNLAVAVNGNGVTAPQVTLCPASLNFGSQTVGTTSAAQTVSISNTGSSDLSISAIGTAGDFSSTSSCGPLPATIPARMACTVNVSFTPTASGGRTGTLTIADSAAGTPHKVALSGTGVAPAVHLLRMPNLMPTVGTQLRDLQDAVEALAQDPPRPIVSAPNATAGVSPSGRTVAGTTGNSISRPNLSRAKNALSALPLSFEPYPNQTVGDIRDFISKADGYSLLLQPGEAIMKLRAPLVGAAHSTSGNSKVSPPKPEESRISEAVLRMKLAGANPAAKASGMDILQGKTNYITGSDPAKWRLNVPNYARVRYEGVYPGIDLDYYGRKGHLEYDFKVKPGGDPKSIRLKFDGATRIHIDPISLDLIVSSLSGDVRFHKPIVFQEKSMPGGNRLTGSTVPDTGGRKRHYLEGKYVLCKNDQVRFALAKYDSKEPLIIDPVVTFSRYFGGSGDDVINGIALDTAGNIYLTGRTTSLDFPTVNAFQHGIAGSPSVGTVFVTKLAPDGATLLYSTYLGGGTDNEAAGIAVDSLGNAYVTGSTLADDFPTLNPIQVMLPSGFYHAFVTKLAPSGSALVYSTYLGGSAEDLARGIALDPASNVYVSGTTNSADFPHTTGAAQSTLGGGYASCSPNNDCADAFVTKINPQGSAFVYSTFLGGSLGETGVGIAADSSGNAFVTGNTDSTDFPVTGGAYQTGYGGGQDGFITKLSSDGSSLIYSTYLGGSASGTIEPSGVDRLGAIAVDSVGGAYVAGTTSSPDFPVTSTLPASLPLFLTSTFITKLHPVGCAIDYSTRVQGGYLGGESNYSLALDSKNNAYLAGSTFLFLYTANPVQSKCSIGCYAGSGYPDGFILELESSGSSSNFSSFIGGGQSDEPQAVAVDAAGNIFVAGRTYSADYISVGDAQPSIRGYSDGFLTKISPANGAAISVPFRKLFFGTKIVNSTSSVTINLRNLGTATLAPTLTIAGDYTETDDCASVAGGGTCDIKVTFTPTISGTRSGSLTVSASAFGSPTKVALTGTGVDGNLVELSTSGLEFENQPFFITTSPKPVVLTVKGDRPLNIKSIVISKPYNQTNDCGTTIDPGTSCTINVTFTPLYTEAFQGGALRITDDATTSPQIVILGGYGAGAEVNLSNQALDFASQQINTTSAPKTITLSNPGVLTLNISSIAVSTGNNGDFSQTNNCGASVPVGGSCTLSVEFTPKSAGERYSEIVISDDAPFSNPQVVNLSGNGVPADFAIVDNSPTNATVLSGQNAKFNLSLSSSAGFSGTVALSCTGAPPHSTCTVNPTSVALSNSSANPIVVTVTTTARSFSLPTEYGPSSPSLIHFGVLSLLVLLFAILMAILMAVVDKRRRAWVGLAVAVLILGQWVSCGGGGGGGGNTIPPTPNGTPAGVYTLTVTATSGNISHTNTLTLTVQ